MEEFILEQNISSSFVENFIKQNPKISDLGETNLDWENELLIKEEKSRNLSHLSFPAVQQNDDFNELPNCLCLNNDEKSQKILDIPPKTPLVCQDKNIQKPDVNVISPPNDTQSFTFLDPFSSPTCKSALKGLCMNATNTSWTSSLASPPPTKPSQTSPIETQPKVQKSSICYHDTPFCLSNKLSSSPATLTSDKSLNTFFNSSFSTKISFNKPAVESLALASLLQESSIHKSPPTSVTHFTFKAFPLVTSSSQKTHHKVQKQKCNSQFLNIEGGETCPCINISNLKKSPKVNHSLTIGNNYQTLKSPNNSPKLQESPAKIHSTNSMHSEDLSIFFSSPASTKSKQEKKVPKKKALKRKNVDDDVFRIDLEDDIKNINNTSPHNTQLDTTNADDNHSVTNIFHTSYTCNKTSPNKNVENDAQESNKRGVDEKNDTSVTDSMLYNATTGSELESGCLQSGGHAVEKTPTNSQNILNPDNYIMKTHDKDTAEKQISNTHILNNEILMMNNASQLYSPTSPFINQHHFTTSTPIRPPKHHVPRTKLFNQISEYPDKILSTQLTKKNKVDGSRARVDGNNVQNCNDDSTIKSQKQNHLSSHLQEVEKMLDGSNTVTIKNKINDEEIQNPPSSTHTPIHTVEDAAGTNDVPTIQPTAHHKLKNSQSSSFSMRNKRSKKFLYPTQAQIISSMPTFVLNNNSQLKQRYNLTLSDEKSKLNENKELCDNYEGYAKHFENYESSKVDLYRIPLGPITTWKNEDKAKLFLYSSLKLQEVETRDKHPSSTIIHKDVPYFNSGLQSDLHDVFTPCEYETAQNAITSYGKVIKTEDTTVGAMLANKLSSVEKQDSCKVSTNNRIHEKDAISRYHTKNDLQSYSTYNTLFDNINIGNNNNLNIGNNNKKNNLNIGNNNKNNNLNIENNNKNFKKDLHVKDNRVCTGFTTGKGGRVEVGATSLHQAGVMLAEKEGVLPCMQNIKPHYNINNNNMGNNDNSHGNNVNDNINNCKKSNNNINNSDNNNNNNDNNVNNNNKANNRNKNGINNNSGDSSDNVDINNDKKQRVTGFRTAGGDRLKVGEDVLHAALTLMDAASDGLPLMHGLSTIRSKPNELDASKFEQDNYIGIGGVQRLKSTTGFKTANGHGLKVNKDTFKKAEVVLTSDDNEVKLKGNAGRYMQSRGYTESCVTDVETGHLTTSQAREVNEVSVLCNTHEFVSTQAFFLGKIEEGYDEVGGDKKGRTSDEGDDEGVEFVEDKVCDSSKHSTSGVFDGFDDDFCDYFDNDKEGGGKQCTDDATPLNNGEYVVCSQQPPSIHQNEFSSRHQNELMKDHSYDVKHDRHYWLASNKMAEKKKEEKDEWGESENYWLMDFMEGDVCDDSSKINNVKNNDEGNNSKNNTTKNSSPSNKDGSHTKDIKQGDNITTITSDQTPTISPLQLPPRLHHHHSSDVTGNFMVTSIKDGEGDKKQNGDKKVLFFQSVRGRKVEVTGQSLKMVKEVLCDNMVSNEKGTESNEKGGVSNEKVGGMASVSTKPSLFQTANGKSVAISEKSMNFVKEMFKDTDISSNANNNNNLNNKNNNHFNKYDHFNNKNNINTLDTNRQPEDIVTKDDVMNDKTKLSKDFVVMKSSKVTNVSSSAFGSNLNIEAYNIPSINTDITQTTSKRNDSKHVSGAPRDITNPVGSIKKVETHPGICVKTSFCTPYNNSVNNVNVESDQHSNANTLTCQFYNTHDDTITQQAFLTEENVNLLKSERELQKMAIEKKMRSAKIKPSMGSLSLLKDANKGSRTQLRDLSKGGCPNNDISKMKEHGVRDNVIGVTAANAEEFKFQRSTSMETEEGGIIIPNDEGFITNQEFHAALVSMRGVDANLVDQGWVCNHYRWVVWKLASMERSFPEVYGGVLLRPEVVMSQLRWRYDEEIVGGRRSVIKRITENDDTPRRGMVLCVVEVEGRERVVLTDGWYCIKCLFDEALWSFLQRKKIKIGTKLVIFGAVLVGNTQACSPLQAPEDMALKISANSTRRALWHAKLGCLVSRKVFKIALNSIVLNGGTVCCVDVVVVRRYPRMFCEWVMENVKGIVRSERLEKKFADAFERKKQKELEEFYEKCQSDFEKKKTKNRKNHMCSTEMETNEEEVEERRREMEVFMKERLQEWKVAHPDRKVRSLLKFQVKGCHWSDVDSAFSCWLTVRDMGGEVDELMREGKRMLISNLTVHTDRHARIHLNTCRSSKFQTLPIDHNFLDLLFQPRHTSTFQHIHSECLSCEVTHHEFDVVCLVVMVTEMCKSESGLQQMIYVVDEEGGVGRLRFWGGLVAYGVESLIKEGLIIACSNLKVDKYYCRDIKKGSSLNHSCNTSFNKSTLSSYQLMNNSSSKNISKTSSNYPTFFFDQSSPNCSNFSTAATPSQWVLMQVNDLTEFTTRPRSPQLKCSFNALNAKLKVKKNHILSIKKVVLNSILSKTTNKRQETSLTLCSSTLSNSSFLLNNTEIDNNKENLSYKSTPGKEVETGEKKDGDNLLKCSQNSLVKDTPMKNNQSGRILRSHARASGLKGKRKSENSDSNSREKIRKRETNCSPAGNASLQCHSILDTTIFTTSLVSQVSDDNISEIVSTQKITSNTTDDVGVEEAIVSKDDESYITSSYVDQGKEGLCYESSVRDLDGAMFDDDTGVGKMEYNEDLLSGVDWMSETQFIY